MTSLLRSIRHNGKALTGLVIMFVFVVMAVVPNLIVSGNPATDTKDVSLGMSSKHLLGTTAFGQDIWLQVVHGARPALLIAIVSGLLATVLSVLIGVAAAYLGGVWDDALNLFTDVVLVLPTLPLVIVIAGYFSQHSISVMIIVLVVTGWSYGARQLRSQALSLRNRDFLEAAKVRGERSSYIIVCELLPNMTSLIVANFLGAALYSLLTASTLEFIGLGDTSSYDWGTMLYWAQNNSALQTGAYVWAAAPGICIALLAAAFALLNNAFDEISNPALRPVRRLRVATS
ncbi:ABC transporter permease [Streptacidiphilus sp. P02-A3a]|uniref:ABC transporter permease n=1 Tax=Streptacidiphilus sp. P02-A3a TaxID=2704468 RepID=UPI0015FD1F6B|nr:ABC transporter permease [Streptacidiphilus sp. P02-A3a]QMU70930.1 ABC transporter permease [Streptacidiphilus sp. P02-A3a]